MHRPESCKPQLSPAGSQLPVAVRRKVLAYCASGKIGHLTQGRYYQGMNKEKLELAKQHLQRHGSRAWHWSRANGVRLARGSWDFGRRFTRRCLNDRINVIAGHLTYVTLLSLVPMFAVMFAMFTAFPMFDDLQGQLEEAILNNLMPASGEALQDYLNRFIENTGQMTTIGVLFLVFVAIMLISTIDRTMNMIFRVKRPRRPIISLAVYWMILTMGPILVGISFAASSYLLSLAAMADEYVYGVRTTLLAMAPYFSTLIAFLMLYVLVPNTVVRMRHAIWGAALAAILFEAAKNAFRLYLQYFPSYELIYGALATIPILIVWVYLSWNIILLGAELTASLSEFFDDSTGDEVPAQEQDQDREVIDPAPPAAATEAAGQRPGSQNQEV